MKRFRSYKFWLLIIIGILSFMSNSWAIHIKIDEDSYINLSSLIRVFYLNGDKGPRSFEGEKLTPLYRWSHFRIYKARIGATGHLNKLFHFYLMMDANESRGYEAVFWEGAAMFFFRPEFVIKIGQIRVPFSRHNFVARHLSPVMTSDGNIFLPGQFKLILKPANPYAGGYKASQAFKRTDIGIDISGEIKNGMFRYYIGIFNQDWSAENKVWDPDQYQLGFGSAQIIHTLEDKNGFEFDARLEFTPTMFGFKPELTVRDPSQRVKQTYLGKLPTMTFGIGFHTERHIDSLDSQIYGTSSLTRKGWAFDFSFEKKFNEIIPGLEIGYIYLDATHFYKIAPNKYREGDIKTWYIDTHLIYGKKIGIGIPGIGFRYEWVQVDGRYKNESNLTYERYGVCVDYFLKGKSNRIGIGFDYVKAGEALELFIKDHKDLLGDDSTFEWYIGVYVKI